MHSNRSLASALATAFLQGPWTADDISLRIHELMDRRWRWIRPLAVRVVQHSFGTPRPRHAEVAAFIRRDSGFLRACRKHELCVENWLTGQPTMRPVDVAASWQLPKIRTTDELANWFGIRIGDLDWFADCRLLGYKQHRDRLGHYRYRALNKRFGHVRLIESPKPRLKSIQCSILTGILDLVPPHTAAQGFRRGTSICTFATPHVGKKVVLRLDLRDFFPSVSLAQVQALFRTIGYPEKIADLLAGLCTNATPHEIWERHQVPETESLREARRRYAKPHLPQGAPGSPALANLCAYRLDCRLSGLAHAAGAVYTRYADDLAFSGDEDFQRCARRFYIHVCAIVMEEGFSVHYRKSRIMHQGVRQQLAGVVVNEKLNVRRSDYDQLKAVLTNCIRFGPDSQNRYGHKDYRRHLEGRIAFVQMVNPQRARRLYELYQRIQW